MKAARPVIASNGVPYLLIRSVGSHSTSGRRKKIGKEQPKQPLDVKVMKTAAERRENGKSQFNLVPTK